MVFFYNTWSMIVLNFVVFLTWNNTRNKYKILNNRKLSYVPFFEQNLANDT